MEATPPKQEAIKTSKLSYEEIDYVSELIQEVQRQINDEGMERARAVFLQKHPDARLMKMILTKLEDRIKSPQQAEELAKAKKALEEKIDACVFEQVTRAKADLGMLESIRIKLHLQKSEQ